MRRSLGQLRRIDLALFTYYLRHIDTCRQVKQFVWREDADSVGLQYRQQGANVRCGWQVCNARGTGLENWQAVEVQSKWARGANQFRSEQQVC